MRDLQKLEIRLAYLMPVAAMVSFVWFLGFVADHSLAHRGIAPLLIAFSITVVTPVFVYWVLGVVSYFAAQRNSRILTRLLWILLFPALYVSAFLLIFIGLQEGIYSLLFYGPAPLVSVAAAIVSLSARIVDYRNYVYR